MISETYSIRRMMDRFFPKQPARLPKAPTEWDSLSEGQKKELAQEYLCKGESALLGGDLQALSFFASACQLDPENPAIWYRQGLSFFEYGSEEGREKAL